MYILGVLLLFRAPSILQSNNGLEFLQQSDKMSTRYVIKLKIVHGKHSQDNMERANQHMVNMLTGWMPQLYPLKVADTMSSTRK